MPSGKFREGDVAEVKHSVVCVYVHDVCVYIYDVYMYVCI